MRLTAVSLIRDYCRRWIRSFGCRHCCQKSCFRVNFPMKILRTSGNRRSHESGSRNPGGLLRPGPG